MKSKPPALRGLYRRGTAPAWKLTSPTDLDHIYIFFGTERDAKNAANRMVTDKGKRLRGRMLGSVWPCAIVEIVHFSLRMTGQTCTPL